MTSIDFRVTRSKAKATRALNVNIVSADYLEKYSSQSCQTSHSIDFGVTRSKVKVLKALNVKMVSADYLEKYSTQSCHTSHSDLSSIVGDPFRFWGHKVKVQGHRGLQCQNGFC
jgi:hypothetical protein